jgi:hypothetical protein
MEGMEPPSGMIMRWFDTLSNFNFSIEHRPGKKHANADAPSRCAHAEEPDPDDEPDEMIAMMHEIINVLEPCVPDWDTAHIRSQQLMDSDVEMIRTAVRTATKPLSLAARAFSPEERVYVGLFKQLFFEEHDVLCRRIPQPNSAQLQEPLSEVQRRRTCLPKHLWETVIEYVHERTAHQGAAATAEKLRNAFF